jgi:cytochrome c oxidase subunit 2
MRRLCALMFAACSARAPTPSPIVQVVPDAAIDAPPDVAADADAPEIDVALRDRGAQLFVDKGCAACHSLDGTFRLGPQLAWGAAITLDDGTQLVVDDAYVRESITDPLAKKRPGFVPVMPVFGDRITPDELDALVMFIKSLR